MRLQADFQEEPAGKGLEPILRAKGLTLAFGSSLALDDVSLDVHAGETLAIMGRSGSGKTTLLQVLAGIRPPDAGSVTFKSRSIAGASDRERTALRRSSFGFVFQRSQLVPELTAIENVALPLLLRGDPRQAADQNALQWMARLGIEHKSHLPAHQLSGGEAQRVAIARALIVGPDVVFADEPTGALDSENAHISMNALVANAQTERAAVLLVTHDEATAAFAGRRLHMDDGKLFST